MAHPFDRPIASPALAPAQSEPQRGSEGELTIALVNNMPDSALKATERQFIRLVQSAAGKTRVRFQCFALPTVARSKQARDHIDELAQRYMGTGYSRPVGPDGRVILVIKPERVITPRTRGIR